MSLRLLVSVVVVPWQLFGMTCGVGTLGDTGKDDSIGHCSPGRAQSGRCSCPLAAGITGDILILQFSPLRLVRCHHFPVHTPRRSPLTRGDFLIIQSSLLSSALCYSLLVIPGSSHDGPVLSSPARCPHITASPHSSAQSSAPRRAINMSSPTRLMGGGMDCDR